MQDARPGPAAEQVAQQEHRRMKQRQPGQREQHEGDRDDPVVGALGRGVTLDERDDRDHSCGFSIRARGCLVVALVGLVAADRDVVEEAGQRGQQP